MSEEQNIRRAANKGSGDKIKPLLNAEQDILFVLLAQILQAERFVGEEHTLFVGEVAPDFHARFDFRLVHFRHAENEKPVVEQDRVARFEVVHDAFIRYGNAALIALNVFGRKGEFVALF